MLNSNFVSLDSSYIFKVQGHFKNHIRTHSHWEHSCITCSFSLFASDTSRTKTAKISIKLLFVVVVVYGICLSCTLAVNTLVSRYRPEHHRNNTHAHHNTAQLFISDAKCRLKFFRCLCINIPIFKSNK